MADEIDEKIEEVIERKVEEKMEKKTRDEIEDSVIDRKIEEKIAEKVADRDKREKQDFVEKTQNEGISRRKFLKLLGVGAGGLALSSSAAGLTWSKITPSSQGTSDIKSSTVKDGAITSAKLSNSSVTRNKLGFNFDENAQDAVGSALSDDFVYDDANNQIDLAFDPSTHATSTELNNHASDPDVHHSRPAGTGSTSESTSWFSVLPASTDLAPGDSEYFNESGFLHNQCRFFISAGGSYTRTLTVEALDMSGDIVDSVQYNSFNGYTGEWKEPNFSEFANEYRVTLEGTSEDGVTIEQAELKALIMPPHSHNI